MNINPIENHNIKASSLINKPQDKTIDIKLESCSFKDPNLCTVKAYIHAEEEKTLINKIKAFYALNNRLTNSSNDEILIDHYYSSDLLTAIIKLKGYITLWI